MVIELDFKFFWIFTNKIETKTMPISISSEASYEDRSTNFILKLSKNLLK